MIILYIGTKTKMISEYYFYKNAYILWAIILIIFSEGISTFIKEYKKEKIIAIIYLIAYILLLTVSITTETYLPPLFDIYEDNQFLINATENLTQDDIDMLTYIYNNKILSETENNVLFIGDFMQEAWIRSIFKYRNRNPLEAKNHQVYVEKWNNGEISYLVCFEKSDKYTELKEYCNLEKSKIIFETENAKIYTK